MTCGMLHLWFMPSDGLVVGQEQHSPWPPHALSQVERTIEELQNEMFHRFSERLELMSALADMQACHLHAACMPPACHLHATCMPPACHLHAA